MAKHSTPDKPNGYSIGSFFRLAVWQMLFAGKLPIKGEGDVVVSWQSASNTYFIKATPSGGGGNGKWRWHPGVKEHDPATAYKTDEVVFISPDSAIVSTGIVDLVSNTLTRTPPGTWIAIKDVPAQVTIAAHDAVPETIKYNVPQLLPTTGANLLDASTVYWHLLQEHNPCVGS